MNIRGIIFTFLLGVLAMPAHADRGIPWQNLSDSEQEMLQKYRRNWSDLDQRDQSRLRRGAQDFMSLPPDRREAVRRKRDEYRQMSPDERRRLRDQYKRRQR